MRAAVVFAIVLTLCSIGVARAGWLDIPDVYRRVEATAQSLIGGQRTQDWEIVKPPANVDPKMALAPPAMGVMRVIPPPNSGR